MSACDPPDRTRALGEFCVDDTECGPGAGCYERRCVKLCAPGEACPEGTVCSSYRCLPDGVEAPTDAAEADVDAEMLPAPDPVAAELRAIRVELEAIRRQQAEILERLDR